ncbi:hypothetical protein CEXT_499201 [Caerostris extrusa]|uniref:PH domain-containing protein n=1 Tax=Caerostris extrusa TaxID=172846 RepID=A0AAV4V637_CAEEX|nr:hypothetical protein CEXT_499201 [Caerostris extrusa]
MNSVSCIRIPHATLTTLLHICSSDISEANEWMKVLCAGLKAANFCISKNHKRVAKRIGGGTYPSSDGVTCVDSASWGRLIAPHNRISRSVGRIDRLERIRRLPSMDYGFQMMVALRIPVR